MDEIMENGVNQEDQEEKSENRERMLAFVEELAEYELSLVKNAEDSLLTIEVILEEMRDLAERALEPECSDARRFRLNREMQELKAEMNAIYESMEYRQLFDKYSEQT